MAVTKTGEICICETLTFRDILTPLEDRYTTHTDQKETLLKQIAEPFNTMTMKVISKKLLLPALLMSATPLLAADPTAAPTWHPQSLGQAIGYMLLFAGIGIGAAVVGYKVFDLCTPGNLHKEILESKNVAAAIVAGSVILGVCIIIAAAMLG